MLQHPLTILQPATSRLLAALAVACLVLAPTAGADSLYAIDFGDGLYRVDPDTGALTHVGDIEGFGSSIGAFGLADRGAELYTFAAAPNRFLQLDPDTAGVIDTVSIPTDQNGEGAVALRDDGTGIVLASFGASGQLTAVDLGAASSSIVGSTLSFDGFDFGPDGTLFALSQSPAGTAAPALYTLDPTDASATLIGMTDFPSIPGNNLGGLTFRNDGTLWAVWNGNLFTIDPVTAETTLVGPTDLGAGAVSNLAGLTWLPEPSPAVFATLILASICGFRVATAAMKTRNY